MKLCKSIPNKFDRRKNNLYKFRLSVNEIFIGEIRDN